MLSAISLGLRALQVIFSAAVLGLSVTLIKGQVYGSSPTTTRYSSFTGGFGIIVAALGVAGLFVSAIPELVVLGFDAVCGILFAAGGIAWAVGLKGISCTDQSPPNPDKMAANGLINQGTITLPGGIEWPGAAGEDTTDPYVIFDRLSSNCKKGMSDEIIQFLCFAVAVGLIALGYVRMRKGGKTGGYIA